MANTFCGFDIDLSAALIRGLGKAGEAAGTLSTTIGRIADEAQEAMLRALPPQIRPGEGFYPCGRILRLRRDHPVWVAGHPMGIRMMSPDPTDPAARVGGDGGPYLFEVRPGDDCDVIREPAS